MGQHTAGGAKHGEVESRGESAHIEETSDSHQGGTQHGDLLRGSFRDEARLTVTRPNPQRRHQSHGPPHKQMRVRLERCTFSLAIALVGSCCHLNVASLAFVLSSAVTRSRRQTHFRKHDLSSGRSHAKHWLLQQRTYHYLIAIAVTEVLYLICILWLIFLALALAQCPDVHAVTLRPPPPPPPPPPPLPLSPEPWAPPPPLLPPQEFVIMNRSPPPLMNWSPPPLPPSPPPFPSPPPALPQDSDSDGIPDATEGSVDTDKDGLPDSFDSDSDNDGIFDKDERCKRQANGLRSLGNHPECDYDSDGVPDHIDSDSDGIEDYKDPDSVTTALLEACDQFDPLFNSLWGSKLEPETLLDAILVLDAFLAAYALIFTVSCFVFVALALAELRALRRFAPLALEICVTDEATGEAVPFSRAVLEVVAELEADGSLLASPIAEAKFGVRRFVTGRPIDAALGLLNCMNVDEDVVLAGKLEGLAAMEREFRMHGTDDDRICVDYILHRRTGDLLRAWPNGVMDAAHPAGMVLSDFMKSADAEQAGLRLAHVAALRLYTCNCFRSINGALRHQEPGSPYPFPVTLTFLSDAIRKLRAVAASTSSAHEPMDLWRGMSGLAFDDSFQASGGTEVAPMSATTSFSVAVRYALAREAQQHHALLLKLHTDSFLDRGAPCPPSARPEGLPSSSHRTCPRRRCRPLLCLLLPQRGRDLLPAPDLPVADGAHPPDGERPRGLDRDRGRAALLVLTGRQHSSRHYRGALAQ